jgi:hypothetical protein
MREAHGPHAGRWSTFKSAWKATEGPQGRLIDPVLYSNSRLARYLPLRFSSAVLFLLWSLVFYNLVFLVRALIGESVLSCSPEIRQSLLKASWLMLTTWTWACESRPLLAGLTVTHGNSQSLFLLLVFFPTGSVPVDMCRFTQTSTTPAQTQSSNYYCKRWTGRSYSIVNDLQSMY